MRKCDQIKIWTHWVCFTSRYPVCELALLHPRTFMPESWARYHMASMISVHSCTCTCILYSQAHSKTMQISWISEWLGVMQVNPHLHPVLLGESAELKQVSCKCHITNVGNTQLIKITNLTHCSWLAWRTSISQEPKENVDLVDREHFSTAFRENLATNLQVGV